METTQTQVQAPAQAQETAAKAKRQPRTPKAAQGEKQAPKGRTTRKAPDASAKPQINYLPASYARPKAGERLASMTRAWMEITGMIGGAAVPTSLVSELLGSGLAYHIKHGRFEKTEAGIVLTPSGKAHFMNREMQPNPEFVEAYKALMVDGTPSKGANVGTEKDRVPCKATQKAA